MHLAQHHFQLQSRYVEDSTAFAVSAVRSDPYGLLALELDEDALVQDSGASWDYFVTSGGSVYVLARK